MIPSERERLVWQKAGHFSADKEGCYPEHAAVQQFDAAKGKRVLEYGCGGGSDAMSYQRRGAHVTFADIVPENVDRALERMKVAGLAHLGVGVKLGHSDALPLDDASVDIVNAHGVLHHIREPLPVMVEFFRVLRSGGQCFVMLYTEQLRAELEPQVQHFKRMGKSEEEAFGWATDGDGTPYAIPYTHNDGLSLFTAAGFVVTDVREYHGQRFRTFVGVKP